MSTTEATTPAQPAEARPLTPLTEEQDKALGSIVHDLECGIIGLGTFKGLIAWIANDHSSIDDPLANPLYSFLNSLHAIDLELKSAYEELHSFRSARRFSRR
jgi:hypothetical protein